MKLISDESQFVGPLGSLPPLLSLEECCDLQLLCSPSTQQTLFFDKSSGLLVTVDNLESFPITDGSPLLYPHAIASNFVDGSLPLRNYRDPLLQYLILSQLKQSHDANAPINSSALKKIHFRLQSYVADLEGITLDIGCDAPSLSCQLFPSSCQYLGLDPFLGKGEFRILALGEILPFADSSVDNIVFNTSLDHILDYCTAIDEAYRVLKPGGCLVLNSYVWLRNATLLTDHVHFHHFREYQLFGALSSFELIDTTRYECPKHDTHRYTLMCKAIKPNDQ